MLRPISTSTSILIAGALIGLGLYFGLRERAATPIADAPAQAEAAPVPTTPPADPTAQAQQYSRAVLELHRPELATRCWNSLRGDGGAPSTTVTFDLTFDANGTQLARGVTEERATAVPGLGQCIQSQLPTLRIPPLGAPARVEVPLTLP